MKKLFHYFLLCFLFLTILLTCGCNRQQDASLPPVTDPISVPTDPTEPTEIETTVTIDDTTSDYLISEGSLLYGADISGMTAEEAYNAVCQSLSQYSLKLTVNGRYTTITASDMSLACVQEELTAYLEALEAGETPESVPALTYDTSLLRANVAAKVNVPATDAYVKYNSAADSFEIASEKEGYNVDLDTVMNALIPTIDALGTSVTATVTSTPVFPSVTSQDTTLQSSMAAANSYLGVSLTYTYSPEGELIGTETIPVDTIASFIAFGDNGMPYVSSSNINTYANNMANKYCGENVTGQFKTSSGSYINITVSYSGAAVDTNLFVGDIKHCVENKISGTRAAPYLAAEVVEDMAFGGTYVEINLSAQHIWMYKSGECIVSSPIVSGCAYYKTTTPTGLYSIRGKTNGTYLVGPTWCSYVQYWMPFNGGIGLHDASWRSSFGGDIYLYDGSHGCVNLPTGTASTIFANASVGTKVIVYGGATSAKPVTQEVTGTTVYDVMSNDPAFKLDAATAYGTYDLTYTSSDTSVAEVSANGTVTVKKPGTAVIIAHFAANAYYNEAQLAITVNVQSVCGDSHTFSEWAVTKEATCVPGEEQRACSVCGLAETRELPPVAEHTFSEWTVTKEATCIPGEEQRACSVCGLTETREVPPVAGHSFSEWTITLEPTCAEGEQTRVCSVCGAAETQVLPPVKEHNYGDWVTTSEPTCVASGEKSQTCTNCGAVNTESIPKKDHAFTDGNQYCGNGCGAENPSYLPPATDATNPSESSEPAE